MNLEELCSKVRRRAGLPPSSEAGEPSGSPCGQTDALIAELAGGLLAKMMCEWGNPAQLPSEALPQGIQWRLTQAGLYIGRLELPADFLQLASLRLDSWTAPVEELILPGQPGWRFRGLHKAGLSGNPSFPKVYWIPGGECGALEIHAASSSGEKLAEALYVPRPRWRDGVLSAPTFLEEAFLDLVAARLAEP